MESGFGPTPIQGLSLENLVSSKEVNQWDSNLRCHKNTINAYPAPLTARPRCHFKELTWNNCYTDVYRRTKDFLYIWYSGKRISFLENIAHQRFWYAMRDLISELALSWLTIVKVIDFAFFFGTGFFQNSSHKLSRIKFVFTVSVLKFMFRAVKGTKYVLFLEYLKFIANCSRAKRKHEKKEIFQLVYPGTGV